VPPRGHEAVPQGPALLLARSAGSTVVTIRRACTRVRGRRPSTTTSCARSRRPSGSMASSSASSERYFQTAVGQKGNTGENLLILLERRLDNVVLSLGLALSRYDSRQLIAHGHVRINGRRMDVAELPGEAGRRDRSRAREDPQEGRRRRRHQQGSGRAGVARGLAERTEGQASASCRSAKTSRTRSTST
jgi:hypothetical protein